MKSVRALVLQYMTLCNFMCWGKSNFFIEFETYKYMFNHSGKK